MGVVVVFDAYSRIGDLLTAGHELARARGTRLEVISVVSPLRSLLLGCGHAMSGYSPESCEDDLAAELDRLVAALPRDVPVRSRLMHGSRRRIRREVAALNPAAVVAAPRYVASSPGGEIVSPQPFVSSVDKSTVAS
jgi:hypothetical protein